MPEGLPGHIGAGTAERAEPAASDLASFSLLRQGPFYRWAHRTILGKDSRRLMRLGVFLAPVTWVPLLLLCAAQDVLFTGAVVPFSRSLGTHARFLLTVPLFFVAEAW